MSYEKIKAEQPVLEKVFFAFSKEQFEEGKKKIGVTDNKKLLKGMCGAIGTKEGLKAMNEFYIQKTERIRKECTPQEVYSYEFWNHECDYICDDSEALQIVIDYFGKERVKKEVKRKRAYVSIDSLDD
jgi:hypothetical protein